MPIVAMDLGPALAALSVSGLACAVLAFASWVCKQRARARTLALIERARRHEGDRSTEAG